MPGGRKSNFSGAILFNKVVNYESVIDSGTQWLSLVPRSPTSRAGPAVQRQLSPFTSPNRSFVCVEAGDTIAGEGYKAMCSNHFADFGDRAEVDMPSGHRHWMNGRQNRKANHQQALLLSAAAATASLCDTISARLSMFALEAIRRRELGMVPNQPLFFADSKDKAAAKTTHRLQPRQADATKDNDARCAWPWSRAACVPWIAVQGFSPAKPQGRVKGRVRRIRGIMDATPALDLASARAFLCFSSHLLGRGGSDECLRCGMSLESAKESG